MTAPQAITRLAVGDRVRFAEDYRTIRYRVRAVSPDGRFAICTRPFNLQRTVIYTIVDFQKGVRGPDDRVFSNGYETDEDCLARCAELAAGDIAVSQRTSRFLGLHIADVRSEGDQ